MTDNRLKQHIISIDFGTSNTVIGVYDTDADLATIIRNPFTNQNSTPTVAGYINNE
ncbi:hypothetical protein FACS1894166_10180 [Bacilli bacterium]|nr:hypothetical protein FACS1894166_10180 [Bacilli bacterium]